MVCPELQSQWIQRCFPCKAGTFLIFSSSNRFPKVSLIKGNRKGPKQAFVSLACCYLVVVRKFFWPWTTFPCALLLGIFHGPFSGCFFRALVCKGFYRTFSWSSSFVPTCTGNFSVRTFAEFNLRAYFSRSSFFALFREEFFRELFRSAFFRRGIFRNLLPSGFLRVSFSMQSFKWSSSVLCFKGFFPRSPSKVAFCALFQRAFSVCFLAGVFPFALSQRLLWCSFSRSFFPSALLHGCFRALLRKGFFGALSISMYFPSALLQGLFLCRLSKSFFCALVHGFFPCISWYGFFPFAQSQGLFICAPPRSFFPTLLRGGFFCALPQRASPVSFFAELFSVHSFLGFFWLSSLTGALSLRYFVAVSSVRFFVVAFSFRSNAEVFPSTLLKGLSPCVLSRGFFHDDVQGLAVFYLKKNAPQDSFKPLW